MVPRRRSATASIHCRLRDGTSPSPPPPPAAASSPPASSDRMHSLLSSSSSFIGVIACTDFPSRRSSRDLRRLRHHHHSSSASTAESSRYPDSNQQKVSTSTATTSSSKDPQQQHNQNYHQVNQQQNQSSCTKSQLSRSGSSNPRSHLTKGSLLAAKMAESPTHGSSTAAASASIQSASSNAATTSGYAVGQGQQPQHGHSCSITGWPNGKDDYELGDVIGTCHMFRSRKLMMCHDDYETQQDREQLPLSTQPGASHGRKGAPSKESTSKSGTLPWMSYWRRSKQWLRATTKMW